MPDLQSHTTPDGEQVVLGCLPRESKLGDGTLPLMSDDWLVPWDELEERLEQNGPIIERFANQTPWIYQGSQGSCTTATAGHGIQLLNAMEGEPNPPLLSQATLYRWSGIDSRGNLVQRRSDNGMALDVAMRLLMKIGMAPADETGRRGIPPMDWSGDDWPDNWRELAAPNRSLEVIDCSRSMHHLLSMMTRGPVRHGYDVHSRLAVRAMDWKGGKPQRFRLKNSWRSEPWHTLTYAQMESGLRTYGAYAETSTGRVEA
jgi:hypothetical protein